MLSSGLSALAEFLVCIFFSCVFYYTGGTGVRGLTRGLATLPQGNKDPVVVKDKVEIPKMSGGEHVPGI